MRKSVDWFFGCFVWAIVASFQIHLRPRTRFDFVVLANDRIGDNFARIPFYRFLRKTFPNQTIAVLANPAVTPILLDLKLFDEVITLSIPPERHSIYWLLKGNFTWALHHSANVVINLVRNYHLGNDQIAKLCKPQTLIEYDNTNQTPQGYPCRFSAPQTFRIPDPIASKSSLFEALHQFAVKIVGHDVPNLLNSPTEQFQVPKRSSRKPVCILAPGAADPKRRWPIERFADVAKNLAKNIPNIRFQITGSSDESSLCQKLQILLPGFPVENHCGQGGLSDLIDRCNTANILITNETGTAHVAAYCGCPTICILGGGDFGTFFPNPLQSSVVPIYHPKDCFRCRWNCRETNVFPTYPCIHEIPATEVSSAAIKLLLENFDFNDCSL